MRRENLEAEAVLNIETIFQAHSLVGRNRFKFVDGDDFRRRCHQKRQLWGGFNALVRIFKPGIFWLAIITVTRGRVRVVSCRAELLGRSKMVVQLENRKKSPF